MQTDHKTAVQPENSVGALFVLVAMLTVASCIFTDEKTTDGGTSSTTEAESATVSSPTDDTGVLEDGSESTGDTGTSTGDGTGAPMACAVWNEQCECGLPLDCKNDMGDPSLFGCGPLGRFDEHGCLRQPCKSTSECGPGGACYILAACEPGACVSSQILCGLDGDQCTWGATADCSPTQGWCIAEGDLPDCP